LLRRAEVWTPTDIASKDMRQGPPGHALMPGATVTCDFVERTFAGNTPKVGCRLDDDVLKVRYGRDNPEVYASVAATRLLWALGFGADTVTPVHVRCRGCPPKIAPLGGLDRDTVTFDVAAVEEKSPGREVEAPEESGWGWQELDLVDEAAGGAPEAHRDALKLLAVFLQHSDNKSDQQRLVCRSKQTPLAACPDPLMMIHDVGETFGRASLLNRGAVTGVNLDMWSKTPIWTDTKHCVGNLAQSQTGTLDHPVISEAGRRFLAGLLDQLTNRQLEDMFAVARFADRPESGGPIDAWVAAFKHKREEISSVTCP